MRARILALAVLLAAAGPALADPSLPPAIEAQNGPEHLADPALEARAVHLQKQFRCLVCQGESIDESNADLAADLRHLVRQQMADGKSDRQIENYLVARYGNFILMKPPVEPDTYLLWMAPFLVLVGAGGVAIWVISRARRASL